MLKPKVSKNEKQRLDALYKLDILDTEAEERFDRLTRLAANYFNVKSCLVSLVDVDRQWFKSKSSFDACETDRDISFCGHAILQNEVMVVPDARLDNRFADNPLVTGSPNIVFYAGAPLSTADGFKVGTLCLIDDKCQTLDGHQLSAFRDFAKIVEQELNDLSQKQLQQERFEANIRTHQMLGVFPDFVFIIDDKFRFIASNHHGDLFIPTEHFIGKTLGGVLPENISVLFERSIKQAFKTEGLITFYYELLIEHSNNNFEARARRISEIEVLVIVRNITEDIAKIDEFERLSMVAQQTNDAVIITDIDKKVLWVNESFTKISGYHLDEMQGQIPGRVLQGPDTDIETIKVIRNALKEQKSFKVDILNYHKAGYPYWIRISCSPWLDEFKKIKGFIAIQSDISKEVDSFQQIQKSKRLLATIIDANSIGTWVINLQTGSLEINEIWAKLLGYSLDELNPISLFTWQDLTHSEDLQKCLGMIQDYDKGLINYYEAPIRMKHKAGHWVWIRTRGSITTRTEDGRAEFMLGTHLDITAQMHAEADLQEQYDYMEVIFENMIDGIMMFDSFEKIQLFNPASEWIFGYSKEEVQNYNINQLIPDIRKAGKFGQLHYSQGKRKNGEHFPMEIGIVQTKLKQETIFVAMLRDVTERKNAEEANHKLAYYDGLTGLPNRRLMFDRLQHALLVNERSKKYVAVLFIDVDNFKHINDSAGHEAGDLLLKQIALRLENVVRESDTVARLGGDEFVVILEDLESNSEAALKYAGAIAYKIKSHLSEPYNLINLSYIGSCCIGITLCNNSLTAASEFLKQADLAMYDAKLAGKNAIQFFSKNMQEKLNNRISVEQDLRNAIVNNEFEVFYQVQVDSEINCIGAELLLRWKHPTRGLVSPMEFIPIAEESGLMVPIGHWVLYQACNSLVRWADDPLMSQFVLAINVSVVELRQERWVLSVLQALDTTRANPAKLKLEVTETVMAYDIDKVIAKLTLLRDAGVSISLDDFGTGYSSLTYLKRLPLNQLKIDKSFVRDILNSPGDSAIAETIVNLAMMMQLDVIAEGVETKAQYLMLNELGCQHFQGYFFGKPEPLESFEKNCLFISEKIAL